MELEALSKRFFVRALETEDVDIIYDLCSKNKLISSTICNQRKYPG